MDARSVVGKRVTPRSNPLFTAYRACLIALHLPPDSFALPVFHLNLYPCFP